MMERYRKDYEYLKKLQNENDTVFNCAITQILTDGIYRCQDYNLDKIANETDRNGYLSKDFQLAIFETAKEISLKVKPWNLLVFFKEEVPARTIKMSYDRLMTILRNVIEVMLYPEDGGDHISESEIMQAAGIDEEEWQEIYGN